MTYRSIELNLLVGCPVKCSYCPQSKFLSTYEGSDRSLSLETLEKVVTNATVGYLDNFEVFFAGFSEPLAAKNIMELLRYCENTKAINKFVVFTTGYKLTEEQLIEIATFKKIKVNFHVGEIDKMINFDKTLWDKLHLIKKYLPEVHFFKVGFDERDFLEVDKKLNTCGIRHTFQKIINRAGNLKNVGLVQIDEKKVSYPVTCDKMKKLKRPVVLPDGTTLACTNDYGCEMKIGNLAKEEWDKLDFARIRKLQQDPKSGLPCFRGCHLAEKDIRSILL